MGVGKIINMWASDPDPITSLKMLVMWVMAIWYFKYGEKKGGEK